MKNYIISLCNPRLIQLSGWVLISLACLLNIWLIEFLFVPDKLLEWPSTFYVYLLQFFLCLTGLTLVLIYANISAFKRYFDQTELKDLALTIFLFLVIIDILLLACFGLTVNHPGDNDLGLLFRLFHIDWEKNIPSTYSALQLLSAGFIALYCQQLEAHRQGLYRPGKYVWLGVSIVLFYMSIDEYFSLHEEMGTFIEKIKLLPTSVNYRLEGYGFTWTLVGGFFVLLIGVPCAFLFFRIFSWCRYLLYLLLLSGIMFVLGAIAMENFQVYIQDHGVNIERTYIMMLEEFFEMFAVSLAIFVFLRYAGELNTWDKTLGTETH